MKVGFIVNIHISVMRPIDCLKEYLQSIAKCVNHDYHIYVIDNGSDTKYNFNDIDIKDNITYKYIENQWEGGITGAWNIVTKMAIDDNCKILLGYNDDLIWNDSINTMITYMKKEYSDNIIYGPVSNNGGNVQTYSAAQKWIRPTSKLHGFLWCFTDKLYHKVKNEKGDFLDASIISEDGKWGGQEDILEQYVGLYNIKHMIYGPCWIHHKKFHLWKEAREYDRGTVYHINQYKGKVK